MGQTLCHPSELQAIVCSSEGIHVEAVHPANDASISRIVHHRVFVVRRRVRDAMPVRSTPKSVRLLDDLKELLTRAGCVAEHRRARTP